jgi:hypothetical protein
MTPPNSHDPFIRRFLSNRQESIDYIKKNSPHKNPRKNVSRKSRIHKRKLHRKKSLPHLTINGACGESESNYGEAGVCKHVIQHKPAGGEVKTPPYTKNP